VWGDRIVTVERRTKKTKGVLKMIKVNKSEWNGICSDYKGIWQDYHGKHPEWKGKRCVMSTCITHNPNELCSLLIEGVHFEII
jgi:hypothetical protein